MQRGGGSASALPGQRPTGSAHRSSVAFGCTLDGEVSALPAVAGRARYLMRRTLRNGGVSPRTGTPARLGAHRSFHPLDGLCVELCSDRWSTGLVPSALRLCGVLCVGQAWTADEFEEEREWRAPLRRTGPRTGAPGTSWCTSRFSSRGSNSASNFVRTTGQRDLFLLPFGRAACCARVPTLNARSL